MSNIYLSSLPIRMLPRYASNEDPVGFLKPGQNPDTVAAMSMMGPTGAAGFMPEGTATARPFTADPTPDVVDGPLPADEFMASINQAKRIPVSASGPKSHTMTIINGPRDIRDINWEKQQDGSWRILDKADEPISDDPRKAFQQIMDHTNRTYPNATAEWRSAIANNMLNYHLLTQREKQKEEAAFKREGLRLDVATQKEIEKAKAMAELASNRDRMTFFREVITDAVKSNPNVNPSVAANRALKAFRTAEKAGSGDFELSAQNNKDIEVPILTQKQMEQYVGKPIEVAVSAMTGSDAMKFPENMNNYLDQLSMVGAGGKNIEALTPDVQKMLIQTGVNLTPKLKDKMLAGKIGDIFDVFPGATAKVSRMYTPPGRGYAILHGGAFIPGTIEPEIFDVTLPDGTVTSVPSKILKNVRPAFLNEQQRAIESERGILLSKLLQGMEQRRKQAANQ